MSTYCAPATCQALCRAGDFQKTDRGDRAERRKKQRGAGFPELAPDLRGSRGLRGMNTRERGNRKPGHMVAKLQDLKEKKIKHFRIFSLQDGAAMSSRSKRNRIGTGILSSS